MIVTDNLQFVMVWLTAIFFTVGASDFPLRALTGPKVAAGTIYLYIRVCSYPFLAAGCWYIMAAFELALNNCASSFGGICFTDPTESVITTTVTPGGFLPLYLLFLGLFFFWVAIGIVLVFYFAFRPAIDTVEGREKFSD